MGDEQLDPTTLVGRYFHAFDESDVLQRQGLVVGEPVPGTYLVLLYDFLVGGASYQYLVRIEDMDRWRFYDSAEWMASEYEAYDRRREAQERREERREAAARLAKAQ